MPHTLQRDARHSVPAGHRREVSTGRAPVRGRGVVVGHATVGGGQYASLPAGVSRALQAAAGHIERADGYTVGSYDVAERELERAEASVRAAMDAAAAQGITWSQFARRHPMLPVLEARLRISNGLVARAETYGCASHDLATKKLSIAERIVEGVESSLWEYQLSSRELSSETLYAPALRGWLSAARKQVDKALSYSPGSSDFAEKALDRAESLVRGARLRAQEHEVDGRSIAGGDPIVEVIDARIDVANRVAARAREYSSGSADLAAGLFSRARDIAGRAEFAAERWGIPSSRLREVRIGRGPARHARPAPHGLPATSQPVTPRAAPAARHSYSSPSAFSATTGHSVGIQSARPRRWRRGVIAASVLAAIAIGTFASLGAIGGQHPGGGPVKGDTSVSVEVQQKTPTNSELEKQTPSPAELRDNQRDYAAILEVAPDAKPALDALKNAGALDDSYRGQTVFDAIEQVADNPLTSELSTEDKPQLVTNFAKMLAFPEKQVWQADPYGVCVSAKLEKDLVKMRKAMSADLTKELLTKAEARIPDGSGKLKLRWEVTDSDDGLTTPVAVLQYSFADWASQLEGNGHWSRYNDRGATAFTLARMEEGLGLGDKQAWVDGFHQEGAQQILDAIDREKPGTLIFVAIRLADGTPHQFTLYKPRDAQDQYLVQNAWGAVRDLNTGKVNPSASNLARYESVSGMPVVDADKGIQQIDRNQLIQRLVFVSVPAGDLGTLHLTQLGRNYLAERPDLTE